MSSETPTRFFIITTPDLMDTGSVSFAFMARSGAPFRALSHLSKCFGMIKDRPYAEDEINPFSLVRGGPAQTAERRIDIHVFESGRGQVYFGSFDYHPKQPVSAYGDEVRTVPSEMPASVLLMTRALFDDFAADLLRSSGLPFAVHHSDAALRSS